jgi:hypothetical protein
MKKRTEQKISWPEGCSFAFTIFDDPDGQSLDMTRLVYSFLTDLGFRTTIGVWPLDIRRETNSPGETCANPEYLRFLQHLQSIGFEIGFHNAAPHSSTREETIEALDRFEQYFGGSPRAMANHYNAEAIYWGPARLSTWRRTLYNAFTLGRKRNRYFGEMNSDRRFWGDVCQQRVRYCRNFVYTDVNTLRANPWMPYSDPDRPYVNYWYSSTEGNLPSDFCRALSDKNQDRLERENGGCIMYTHFGHGFVQDGRLDPDFRRTMERLARRKGWFVPVSAQLDYLSATKGPTTLTDSMRRQLETRWLFEKIFRGTS